MSYNPEGNKMKENNRRKTITDEELEKVELDVRIYMDYTLSPTQIDKFIDEGVALASLYSYQELIPASIYKAIEKGEALSAIYRHQKLSSALIDHAIEHGYSLHTLYIYQKLGLLQIDKAIEKGLDLDNLYTHQKLNSIQVDEALEKGIKLFDLYSYQTFSSTQIDKAIEIGALLDTLLRRFKFTPVQISTMMARELYLGSLYTFQKLQSSQIDEALEIGEELYMLYEYQQLMPSQIDRALDIDKFVDILLSYQKQITSKHINYAIRNEISLDFLYTSPLTTPKQKVEILEKLGIEVPESVIKSKLWSQVSPKIVMEAIKQFDEAIKSKMKESPIYELVGTYEVSDIHNAWNRIKSFLNTKSMVTKENDYRFAYYTGKDMKEKKIKIGRVLKDKPDLLKEFSKIRQFGAPEEANLEIKISIDPEHIAMKSTSQTWTSCETIGAMCGLGEECGWCDDIIANNLIAYIKFKDRESWLGRVMIRWCIREDDELPDAVIEHYYGRPAHKDILISQLITTLRSKGFTGILGDKSCLTTYDYSGYVDSGIKQNGKILYKIGDRPK